tara:strand:- start:8401 stop:10317 length:1917 start_codon:yes stop_codon:yes gene_type:complete
MANYIKSFNFRNGVQVDNDNFIVNAVGRVGIGTTVPEKLLDVRGNAKVVGHITATDASVSGIVTVGSITINGSTGTISATTFSGSAGNFGDQAVVAISTDGFIAGATGLTTTSNLGIGTNSTAFELQVGSNPETSTGFGVTSGNVTASGNLKISGISTLGVTTVTNLTGQQLNVSGVSTITTLKVGTGITAEAGIITATTFDGNLTGDVTGNVTGNLNSSGVSTITTLKVGTGITAEAGVITATTFDGNAGTATSLSNSRDFSITGDLEASVISFDGTSNVSLASTLSNSFNANTTGIITAATIVGSAGSFSSIGIQTSAPSADLQIRKASGDATLEVISDTSKASISIGNSVGTGNSSASINYGSTSGFGDFSTSQSLDIINRDTGYINYFLSSNASDDSSFVWHKGSTNQLMSLTKDGNLGIGITNPEHLLSVQGISTFTGNAHFNGNVTIDGTISISAITATLTGDVTGDVTGNVTGNVFAASGISTFTDVRISDQLGIGTNPHATDYLNICPTVADRFTITSNGRVGIRTDTLINQIELDVRGDIQAQHGLVVGMTTEAKCAVDMSSVVDVVDDGTSRATIAYMIPPRVTTAQRDALRDTDGNVLSTDEAGATVYNITTNKLQVWNGSTWNDCF